MCSDVFVSCARHPCSMRVVPRASRMDVTAAAAAAAASLSSPFVSRCNSGQCSRGGVQCSAVQCSAVQCHGAATLPDEADHDPPPRSSLSLAGLCHRHPHRSTRCSSARCRLPERRDGTQLSCVSTRPHSFIRSLSRVHVAALTPLTAITTAAPRPRPQPAASVASHSPLGRGAHYERHTNERFPLPSHLRRAHHTSRFALQ